MENKKSKKHYLYYFVIGYQLIAIITTIINLIYSISTKQTVIFPISISSVFPPLYFILNGSGIWNVIPLILLLSITIYLFYKSSKAFLQKTVNLHKNAIAINAFWLINNIFFTIFYVFNFSGENEPPFYSLSNFFISIFMIYAYLAAMFVKNNYIQAAKSNWQIKKYSQIKNYAYCTCFAAFYAFVLDLSLHYFLNRFSVHSNTFELLNFDFYCIGIFIIIAIFLFIYTNISYFDFKKTADKQPPCKQFIFKLNLLQIGAIILSLVLSSIIVIYF